MIRTFLQRWLRQPQGVWARKAVFQIHLWAGVGVGLYILLISVSGSAIVFRAELHKLFTRPPITVHATETRLAEADLTAAAMRAYPGWTINKVWETKTADQPVEIWLERGQSRKQRIFDPYTAEDLGHPEAFGVRAVLWLVDLHDNLLYAETGRKVNGAGAILLTVLCVTGAVIWWPGLTKWRQSLQAQWNGNWKRFNWGLHSAVGFWSFLFVLVWALSGIYLAFPEPFSEVVEYFEPTDPNDTTFEPRVGDEILRWSTRLHFGRFAGWPVKTLWVVLGFAPVLLFITGAVMWWNRVLRPARQVRQQEEVFVDLVR
jgi:uncharacterized iron-regulated membrane protein